MSFVSQSNVHSTDPLTGIIISKAVTLEVVAHEVRFIFMADNYGLYKALAYRRLNHNTKMAMYRCIMLLSFTGTPTYTSLEY